MSKLSQICLFLLIICILSNLSSVESNRNGTESTKLIEHRIQKRIVGGWFTEKHQNTVFGLLLLVLDSSHTCTGTFIAPNAILTAAHCCENFDYNDMYIYNIQHEIVKVTVLKYHINPEYKSDYVSNDDIAIIELTENFEGIIPAKLDYSEVDCGETVWMYGYGRTNLSRTEATDTLKELPAEVAACSWYFRLLFWLMDNDMILTYSKIGALCDGDSGGPMFTQNGALVGVHSGSNADCAINKLTEDVRVSSHKRFIQTVLHQNGASNTLNLNSPIFFILIAFYAFY